MADRIDPQQGGLDLLVLVVEDEFLIAMDLQIMLENAGHIVLGPVGSVAKALQMLERPQKPDVAVLDVNLRGQLVLPVVERLRSLKIPFVIASAYGTLERLDDALAEAENLGKPIHQRHLLDALNRAVR